MSLYLLLFAAVVILASLFFIDRLGYLRHRESQRGDGKDSEQALAEAAARASELVEQARREALAVREALQSEISVRQEALEARDSAIAERERTWRERQSVFDQRRFAFKKRREEIETRIASVEETKKQALDVITERSGLERDAAKQMVLDRLDSELQSEQPERVQRAVDEKAGDAGPQSRTLIVAAMQRQDSSHADTVPRITGLPLEDLDEMQRERVLTALQVVAESTSTELGVDEERQAATLRGLDPVGREIARQASLEVLDRRLQVAEVPPLLNQTRQSVTRRIAEIGDRVLWEMEIDGRPELAELIGTLNYRFSYGQNALLHCKETGYLCGVLAAELGLPQAMARQAGMLHDIGKAVDHDVEGSHAIIGGELLRVMGTDPSIVHAVKAHHFDEEPSTDLAMLTICADAISASRPGARRDTLAAYLQRLEQLQTIATRHNNVERAFPLQAGREVRIYVKAKQVDDEQIVPLSFEIAREIENEMQYPGVIKVTVIRETQALATAPAQIGRGGATLTDAEVAGPSGKKRRRRRKRPTGAGAGGNGASAPEQNSGSSD